ncbi:MobF family relaxase [Pirellulaceae bacterium SH449]
MTATITALPSGGDGAYYLSEYHLGEGKELGTWWGGPSKRLGLSEFITKEEFQPILSGVNPHTQRPLAKQHRDRVPAVDLTFSVEKSVSATWAVSPPEVKLKIERCAEESIKETLSWVQSNLTLVRKGKGGHIQERGDFLAAIFKHETNRNGDPNLHWHCVIPNLVFDQNGKCSHIHTQKIFDFTRTLGPMFRASLARRLRTELKLELIPAENKPGQKASWFKLPGVPADLLNLWSSRKNEIDDFLIPRGLSRDSASPQYRASANTATRQSKERLPPLDILRERWNREAKAYGFSHQSTLYESQPITAKDLSRRFTQAFRDTVKSLEREKTHFAYKDLLRGVAEEMQDCGISVNALTRKLDRKLLNSKSVIRLANENAERVFTTKGVWRQEERLLQDIDRLDKRGGAMVSDATLKEVLTARPSISAEQAKAVQELTQAQSSLRLLRGVAGAGKTYTLDAVRQAFEKSGYEVMGTSTSGLAKETLESDAGIKSRTVASLLYQITGRSFQGHTKKPTNPFHAKSVLIVDEASMVDLRGLQTLTQAVRRAKATLILVGDDKQLQAIGAGGPFKYLLGTRRAAVLEDNRRQKTEEDRQAVKDLRMGDTEAALKSYLERGRLKITDTRPQAARELVKRWARSGGALFPERHSIFTQTRQEAAYLNQLCQTRRTEEGTIYSGKHLSNGDGKFYARDRVLFNKADKTQGVQNGHRGTVLTVHPEHGTMKVLLDSQKDGLQRVVLVSAKRMKAGDITLGYAATTHKMQGQTTAHSYVLLGGGMTDNNMAYTQMTRGSESTTLFIDTFSAGNELTNIARAMRRSNSKSLAHEFHPTQQQASPQSQMSHSL